MARRCEACQARVSRKAAWCPACGAALGEPALGEPEKAPQPRAYAWITWVLAGLLVLTLVAAYFVLHSNQTSTVASDGQQTAPDVRAALLTRASVIGAQAFTLAGPTLDKDLAAAEKLMTPEMAGKFAGQLDAAARATLIKRGEVHTASVQGAWAISIKDDAAQIVELLVVKTTVKGGKGELVNVYPLRIDLTKVNGTWLAADVERLA